MSEGSSETPDSAAVLESMTLLATLSTAADVCEGMAERRMGHDPSAQEPSGRAAAHVQRAGRELMDLLMQLALSRIPLARRGEAPLSNAVRHFDVFMKLRRVERRTKEMHQRLLSLYPQVSESLVEEARILRSEVDAFLEADPTDPKGPPLETVLERGLSFVVWTRHEVSIGFSSGSTSANE